MNAMTPGGAATEATLASLANAQLQNKSSLPALISNGTSLSPAVDLGLQCLVRIDMPAAWTTAALTFQVSVDGVTYRNLYDYSGNEFTVVSTVALANRAITVVIVDWLSVRFIKVRSGTSASPVNQGQDSSVGLVAG
jgi:hypothetical protein